MERKIKRGDIYYANLNPVIGSEQGGTRPVSYTHLSDKKGNMVVVECTPILKKVRAAEIFENGVLFVLLIVCLLYTSRCV